MEMESRLKNTLSHQKGDKRRLWRWLNSPYRRLISPQWRLNSPNEYHCYTRIMLVDYLSRHMVTEICPTHLYSPVLRHVKTLSRLNIGVSRLIICQSNLTHIVDFWKKFFWKTLTIFKIVWWHQGRIPKQSTRKRQFTWRRDHFRGNWHRHDHSDTQGLDLVYNSPHRNSTPKHHH